MKRSGFTLLELTIVIAIIGLIMGGIVIGQSVISNAKITTIISEVEQYRGAMETFYDQYEQLPGDFNRAQDLWGAKASCSGAGLNVRSTTSATCNGNGSGKVSDGFGNPEGACFWQHLENAKLLEEDFSCANGNGTDWFIPGIDIARAGKTRGGWLAQSSTFNVEIQSFNPYNAAGWNGTFTPQEMQSIDTKLDDGLTSSGNIRGGGMGSCTSGSAYSTSYKLPNCTLLINMRY